jgi:hypothetical protein
LSPRAHVQWAHWKREARERIETALIERHRACHESNPARIEMDFPKRTSRRATKEQIAAELDQLDPGWRSLYVLYPTEDSLRSHGE